MKTVLLASQDRDALGKRGEGMTVQSSIWRGAVLVVAMAVGACAEVRRIPSPYVSCGITPPDAFQAVDWDTARRVNVSIRHGEFQPSLIRLYQDRPYVMRVENRDRASRRFQSSDFFAALYIHSIVTEGYGPSKVKCPAGLWTPPGGFTEIRFIAARDGRYEFADTMFPFNIGTVAEGIVRIEQAPAIAALLPPAIPGITRPDAEIPTGPYAPASVPVAPPMPEAPAMPVDPALLPVPMPPPETPAMPVDPAALPVPMPAPEMPAMPVDPAALPVPMPAPEMPAMPVDPVTLPIPMPAPEIPGMPVDPALLPLPSPTPEIPGLPADPILLPLPPLAPETPMQPVAPAVSAIEPPSAAPMIPTEEEKGPAIQPEPLDPALTLPPPRSLLPEHAPGNVPARKANGGAPFGQ